MYVSKPFRCPSCKKEVQQLTISDKRVRVDPGVIRFTRCPYAMTSFYDMHGNLVKGYKSDDPEKGESGYAPHDGKTSCFRFPFD